MSEKVAVVTGAAGGIGQAIARALLEQGLFVIGVDVDEEGLEDFADSLPDALAPFFLAASADLTAAEVVADLFFYLEGEYGGVDALVNNAGTCFVTDFVKISPEELERQMAINFESAFYCCQRAIPLMLERPGVKKIVNISSNGAYNFDVFDPAHYRASKAALDTLTKHLARQYAGSQISVNSIAPAMTRTPLFDVVEPDVLEAAIAGMPRGKPMEPEEIAAWVAFLISPAGDCASGNVILLNQGRDVR
ncbi:MAG: SDR family oxidoreductase [Candidatus Promineifilaceae bacterium]|nr:SDR family oxidoreductase [Candidatus Promineifilaceae bacterium]